MKPSNTRSIQAKVFSNYKQILSDYLENDFSQNLIFCSMTNINSYDFHLDLDSLSKEFEDYYAILDLVFFCSLNERIKTFQLYLAEKLTKEIIRLANDPNRTNVILDF